MSDARRESRGVPAPRRLSLLLVAGVLALGAAAPASARSQDGDLVARAQTDGSARAEPSLTHRPRTSRSGSSSAQSSGSGSRSSSHQSGTSDATTTRLPYTGADARLVGLLGLALVLLGIGLRLRTADVRR